jgi:ubiquinone/menaquinone biosynthesis C-methylase UbiE
LPETVKHGAPGRAVLIDRFPAAPRGQTAGLVCADAARLPLAGESLEFLVSAHCLEHCPDVLAVLREWRRVLRPGAALVLVLPHVDRTFDHGRPTSDYDHHVADLGVVGDGTDDAHWADWEQFSIPQHDHEWLHDEGARRADGSWDRQYLVQHGDVHFHAWTQHEMVEILFRNGFFIRDVAELLPERDNSFMVVVTRPAE